MPDEHPAYCQHPAKFNSWTPYERGDRFFKRSRNLTCSLHQRVMFGSLTDKVRTFPSLVYIHLLQVKICILFVTQGESMRMQCMFICDRSSHQITNMKRLVTIDLLVVQRKNASWKTLILEICTANEKMSWFYNHLPKRSVTIPKIK